MPEIFIPGKTRILYGGVLFGQEERDAVVRVLDSNWWGIAEETKKFEQEIAKVQGVDRAIFVNSGTSALDIGIRSLKLPSESEVVVPACTFPTPIASLINANLRPVVTDVELGNYFMSPDSLEESLTPKTSALLVVYVAGATGQLDRILEIAQRNNLLVIEDNCDGFGGKWKRKMLGSFGTLSTISTHPAHIISTGGGGVMLTNDHQIADTAISIRDWGRDQSFEDREDAFENFPPEYRRYIYTSLGSNYQPLELQAAMGRIQLRRLDEFKRLRKRNFDILTEILSEIEDEVLLPSSAPKSDPCWYTYPILTRRVPRKNILDALDKNNIEWRPILAGNINMQPAFKERVITRTETPNANQLINNGFWVSLHPQHNEQVMEYVGSTIKNAVRSY